MVLSKSWQSRGGLSETQTAQIKPRFSEVAEPGRHPNLPLVMELGCFACFGDLYSPLESEVSERAQESLL